MRYFGVQFRMARGATRLKVSAICKGARMSARTLAAIEDAEEIEYGVKEKGCFEESTVAKLVGFYERLGVRFLSAAPPAVGYQPTPARRTRKAAV